MKIYEIFRKTKETYIFLQININGNSFFIINFYLYFLKHMLEQFILNSFINLNIILISDLYIDTHHLIEDLGITLGLSINLSLLNKNNINRYGFSYVPLDESLSRVVLDFCGRSYLKYDIFFYNNYIGFFDLELFYDFFFSLSCNSFINFHIINLYGFNSHHKIESIFKSLGISFKNALMFKLGLNSSKGFLC